jgi:purine-binding chemotaxis protein CheW
MSLGGEITNFDKVRRGEIDEANLRTDYLIIYLADQIFGIPVPHIQDVLAQQKVTKVPLSPPEVAGALNLRGRIVTAIDVRCRLGLPKDDDHQKSMSVVVEHNEELYSLIIDKVGDVLSLKDDEFEDAPPTMDSLWRNISNGIFRMDDQLLVILDVSKLLGTVH